MHYVLVFGGEFSRYETVCSREAGVHPSIPGTTVVAASAMGVENLVVGSDHVGWG